MSGVLKLSLFLSLALMMGRLSGLVREMVLAARFGVSDQADLAITLLTLPDILVGALLVGGFGAALVPAFRLMGPDAPILLRRVLLWVGAVFLGLAGLVALFPGVVLSLLSPSTPFMFLRTAAFYLQITALAIPLTALAGVLLAYANARERFFAPGLGTLVFNLSVVGALLILAQGTIAFWPVVAGILLGALLRLGLLTAITRRAKSATSEAQAVPPGLAKRFILGTGATILLVAAPVAFRSLVAAEAGGALSAFAFALKLFELPTALIFAPLSTVLLSRMVQHYADRPHDHGPVTKAVASALLFSVVAIVIGWLFGQDIAQVLFGRGAMGADGIAQISAYGQMMFLGLPGAGVALICAAGLNAQARAGRVFAGTAVAFALALSLGLIWSPIAGFVLFYTVAGLAHAHALGLKPPRFEPRSFFRPLAFGVAVGLAWGLSWATDGQSVWLRSALAVPVAGLLLAPYLGMVLNLRRIAKPHPGA